jgi:hypothetical protein
MSFGALSGLPPIATELRTIDGGPVRANNGRAAFVIARNTTLIQ